MSADRSRAPGPMTVESLGLDAGSTPGSAAERIAPETLTRAVLVGTCSNPG